MNRHLSSVLKKVTGVILIILGLIGTLIPIPLVPFFLLVIVGLGFIGVKSETINKIKLWVDEFVKKVFK